LISPAPGMTRSCCRILFNVRIPNKSIIRDGHNE
jgi:hypothetical protein